MKHIRTLTCPRCAARFTLAPNARGILCEICMDSFRATRRSYEARRSSATRAQDTFHCFSNTPRDARGYKPSVDLLHLIALQIVDAEARAAETQAKLAGWYRRWPVLEEWKS